MTERIVTQETLPGMSERETLEALSPSQLVDYIMQQGESVTVAEKRMNLAGEILEGAYGTTFEAVLKERENGNKQE